MNLAPALEVAQLSNSAVTISVARGSLWWAAWSDLISFRPSTEIQRSIRSRSNTWYIHKLEDGAGPINLDFYPVRVSRLPPGIRAEGLLEMLRTGINTFVNPKLCRFDPYDDKYPPVYAGDKARWLSPTPEATIISISMRMGEIPPPSMTQALQNMGVFSESQSDTLRRFGILPESDAARYYVNPDDGSVLCSYKTSRSWMFSTLYTDEDKGHPVSGNRQFGFMRQSDGSYIFFTRGADRATSLMDDFPLTPVFFCADTLWKSMQERLADFVKRRNGKAEILDPICERVWWTMVKRVAWAPTVPWVE